MSKIHCAPISGFSLISNSDLRDTPRIVKHNVKLRSPCIERTLPNTNLQSVWERAMLLEKVLNHLFTSRTHLVAF